MTLKYPYHQRRMIALGLVLSVQSGAAMCAPSGQLEEVIVTAIKREQKLIQSPVSMSVIDSRAIRETLADNMADLLADVPGVQISDSGQAGMRRVRIRGEESNRVAILIDGQEITDHRGTGVPLSIDPSMVERVEIIRGGGGVLYGSKALGGVVNFITKRGGDSLLQARIGASYRSANEGRQAYGGVHGSSRKFDYRLAFNTDEQKDRKTPLGEIDNTRSESESYYVNVGYRGDVHSASLSFDNHNASSEVFVEDSVRFTPPFIDFALEIPQRDRQKIAIFYEYDIDGKFFKTLKADAFSQTSERVFNTFPTLQLGPTIRASQTNSVSQLDTQALNIYATFNFGDKHTAVAGLQILDDNMEQTRRSFDRVNNAQPTLNEEIMDQAETTTQAIYLHDEWQISSAFSINAGLRKYWVNSELVASSRQGLPANEKKDEEIITSLAALYSFSTNNVARLSYSEGYVYPNLLQLQTGAIAGASFANPNAKLVPENSENYEIGYRFFNSNSEYDISVFASKAENYIDFVPCEDMDDCIGGRRPVIYKNIGRSDSFGAEFHTSFRHLDNALTSSANITWMKRKNITQDLASYDSGNPLWSGNASLRYQLPTIAAYRPWIKGEIRFESKSLDRFSNRDENETGGWLSANLHTGLSFGKKSQHVAIIEVANLGDKLYRYASENIYAAGRSINLKIELNSL